MTTSRRDFLQTTAAAALGLSAVPLVGCATSNANQAQHPLRILVLGGTGFIGPHLVQHALDRGHTLTLFNRGRTNTHLFPDVEKLVGDRSDNLTALEGHTWDVVIDNSASRPTWVRASAQLLKDSTESYLFTSTRSVYSDFSEVGLNEETGQVFDHDLSMTDQEDDLGYGPRKSLCEREAKRAFPERTLIVRPGLIVGPGDQTDRFTYWPARVERGGEVLAPGAPNNNVMFIDVRDLAEWYVHLVEEGTLGVLNALGPAKPLTFEGMLDGVDAVTTNPVSFTWASTDFLLENEVRPYSHMPLWMPAQEDRIGFNRWDLSRPLAAGLKYRPLEVTARDTLAFHKSRPIERQQELRAGISAERESELLAAWHQSNA